MEPTCNAVVRSLGSKMSPCCGRVSILYLRSLFSLPRSLPLSTTSLNSSSLQGVASATATGRASREVKTWNEIMPCLPLVLEASKSLKPMVSSARKPVSEGLLSSPVYLYPTSRPSTMTSLPSSDGTIWAPKAPSTPTLYRSPCAGNLLIYPPVRPMSSTSEPLRLKVEVARTPTRTTSAAVSLKGTGGSLTAPTSMVTVAVSTLCSLVPPSLA
mmetsp:Transcript_12309/g.24435  ORF Transcript_12309/g.24435 Transcript_12309/m.24435 type:complete len:214 (-) Transcript_12309:1315-1956(-)